MRKLFPILGAVFIASLGMIRAKEKATQEKPKDSQSTEAEYKIPQAEIDKQNPVKPTPEGLAAARKMFGYDCAMCHGESGNGKGELVESMSLKMKDWHDASVLTGLSDGDIYDLIVKGKDKMVGEGDRLAPAKVWGLVHYVRSFQKKSSAT